MACNRHLQSSDCMGGKTINSSVKLSRGNCSITQGEERLDLGCVAALGGEMYGGLRELWLLWERMPKDPLLLFFFSWGMCFNLVVCIFPGTAVFLSVRFMLIFIHVHGSLCIVTAPPHLAYACTTRDYGAGGAAWLHLCRQIGNNKAEALICCG